MESGKKNQELPLTQIVFIESNKLSNNNSLVNTCNKILPNSFFCSLLYIM